MRGKRVANTVDRAKREGSDTCITAKVKAELLTEKGIPRGDIKVETSRGVVSLSSDVVVTCFSQVASGPWPGGLVPRTCSRTHCCTVVRCPLRAGPSAPTVRDPRPGTRRCPATWAAGGRPPGGAGRGGRPAAARSG
ncbi:BON domain-containing protein [Streptomyces sp. Go40/10]|uniref:BON domain-containing protein n=1 Tax=Streptomyces sp. Go40/10 TaxID=2825844 RepID=UPI003FA788E0